MSEINPRLSAALADRYRIERVLGQGGMATVYLAEDIKHDRKVALKVLKPELAAVLGAERFIQEIKTTANLQHPHILPLFDSGQATVPPLLSEERGPGGEDRGLGGGMFLYYVMPFIDGETLRDRLDREHQLGIDEAVRIATEVADALDYAHRSGVVHRDIKPENILLHDGRPMVADFGIALAVSAAAGGRMTETGLSLGTPHYMSPEQATAEKEITARSDVYSLGSVLYEMLAGTPPHMGGSAQQIIMKIVTEEAQPLTQVRKSVPANVAAAVAKALERLPADRFTSAHDFAAALTNVTFAGTAGMAGAPLSAAGRRQRLRDPFVLVPTLVAVLAVAVAVVLALRPQAAEPLPPFRFVVSAGDSTRPFDLFPYPAATSPDGDMVVYSVATDAANNTMLYLLRTDQLEARPIPGTANGYQPYFSPDGAWLAFEGGGKERKVRLDGSAPVAITDASGANGAAWTAGGEIVLGSHDGIPGLSLVSAAGGESVVLTHPDSAAGESEHLWPIAHPDGRTIVFVLWSGSLATSRLGVTSTDDGRVVPLGIEGIRPLAVIDGMLVYVRADGAVMAISLDARGRRTEGRAIPVHDPVPVASANNGNSGIFVSPGGALVTSGGSARGRLVWVAPDGSTEAVMPEPRAYSGPRLSPDEQRIAVVVTEGQQSDVWIYDMGLGTFSRLTSNGSVTSVQWTADGSRVLFTAGGEEVRGAVWLQFAAGGSPAEKLFEHAVLTPVAAISPDDNSLLITSLYGSSWNILRVPLDSELLARDYLATPAGEGGPEFSPDGRWVALQSGESGQTEVYVRSFPDPSFRVQVSAGGGGEPTWSPDGTRLYYRSASALLAARVSLSPSFAVLGRDTIRSNVSFAPSPRWGPNYQVTRDGRSILAIVSDADDFRLVVSPNWITEFRRRVAESRGN